MVEALMTIRTAGMSERCGGDDLIVDSLDSCCGDITDGVGVWFTNAPGPFVLHAGDVLALARLIESRAAPREPGGDLIRRADVLAAIREASVHYEAGHESWLVSPHRLSETIQVLSVPRPDAGDGTGETR